MPTQKLAASEKRIIAALANRAGLAAALLDVWAGLPERSIQSERSLIDLAQLGLTEERATKEVLTQSVEMGLLEASPSGYIPCEGFRVRFPRLALALYAIEHYLSSIHRDATTCQVVLTKPPKPSVLECKLADLGWRTSELEPTDHAFHSMVRLATERVVVVTPFFDIKGASWLCELFSVVAPRVERYLVLRSLEDQSRRDYPQGYDAISSWLRKQGVIVMNYSLPRPDTFGRETFHAKVILCDRDVAYLGSSNMNAASLEHSMELGVTIRGRAAHDVAMVVDAVIAASHLWP